MNARNKRLHPPSRAKYPVAQVRVTWGQLGSARLRPASLSDLSRPQGPGSNCSEEIKSVQVPSSQVAAASKISLPPAPSGSFYFRISFSCSRSYSLKFCAAYLRLDKS